MCSNSSYQAVLDRVAGAGIQTTTIIENVGHLVREEAKTRVKRQTGRMNWDSYQRCTNK